MVIILELYISSTIRIEKTPYTIIAYGVFSYNYLLILIFNMSLQYELTIYN